MATKRKKPAKKKALSKKKAANKSVTEKKPSPKKTTKKVTRKTVARRVTGKKKTAVKAKPTPSKRTRPKGKRVESQTPRPPETRARAGGQSGDLQGLSDIRSANSESVDELLEEGNAFEADVVKGVEEAGNEPEHEVHTHEVLEDDVPEEYLDKD